MDKKDLELYMVKRKTSLVDVMNKIDINANGVVFVVDDENALCGSASDGDIRRWIIKTGNLNAVAEEFMHPEPCFVYQGNEGELVKYKDNMYNSMRAIPLLDGQKRIVDIFLLNSAGQTNKKGSLKGIPVVIMAGGKGTRLYPYTKILPKPLIPIGDVPIMERIIDLFTSYQMEDYYISVNYKKEMIKAYFRENEHEYKLHFIEEDAPLGTAGSLRLIGNIPSRPFFVTNCDILIQADYYDIYSHHQNSRNAITIVSSLKNDIIPYGVVHSTENGEIINIEEKPCRNYFINTGMYIINPELVSLIPEKTVFHMTDLVEEAMKRELKVGMYPISADSFLDMGEFEEMQRMEEKLDLMP